MVAIAPAALLLLTPFCLFSPSSPRGNSKYHYYGIRVKPDSPLNRLQEDTQYMAMRQQPVHQKPRFLSLSLFYSAIVDHFFVHLSSFAGSSPSPPPTACWVCRFKPLQKVDGLSDSVCGSSQHCGSTPEQSVAAQSQHHQQYIGRALELHLHTAPLRWEDGVHLASLVPFYPDSCLGPALVSVDDASNAGFHLLCSQTRLTACPPSLLLT